MKDLESIIEDTNLPCNFPQSEVLVLDDSCSSQFSNVELCLIETKPTQVWHASSWNNKYDMDQNG